MDELTQSRIDLLQGRTDAREQRRTAREQLWRLRQILNDPNLSPEDRAEYEDIAFRAAQTLEAIEQNLSDIEEALANPGYDAAPSSGGGEVEKFIGTLLVIFLAVMLLIYFFS